MYSNLSATDKEKRKLSLCSMKFPEKLWMIVNECVTGAIGWGQTGETITLEYSKFQEEYLNCGIGVFKTSNVASFVRQLNLYGFRKCNRYNEEVHEFKHPLFLRGRKDLVEFIKRKPGSHALLNSSVRASATSRGKCNSRKSHTSTPNTADHKAVDPASGSSTNRRRMPFSQLQMPDGSEHECWNRYYPSNACCSRSRIPHDSELYPSRNNNEFHPEVHPRNEENFYWDDPAMRANGNIYFVLVPAQNRGLYPGFYDGTMHMPFPMAPEVKSGEFHNPSNSFLGQAPQ